MTIRFRSLTLTAAVCAAASTACIAQLTSEQAAQQYGWGFRNFTDRSFSWDIYRNSFFGVPADSNLAWATATFDKLFYELAFRTKLPDPGGTGDGAGNCFGLSLLSLMMNKFGGYYGFCAPPGFYRGDTSFYNATGPNDSSLHRVVNIMHGRQLSLGVLESYFDQSEGGKSQNAGVAVQVGLQIIGKEGPCVVSITKKTNPADGSGGHSLICYSITNPSPGHYQVWVVDPNRIWVVPTSRDRGWYTSHSNYIDCNGSNWSFLMAGETTPWPDGPGNLIFLPLSMAGPPGRVPSSLGMAIGQLLGKLFLSGTGNASVRQGVWYQLTTRQFDGRINIVTPQNPFDPKRALLVRLAVPSLRTAGTE
jgi:hypothetical protein